MTGVTLFSAEVPFLVSQVPPLLVASPLSHLPCAGALMFLPGDTISW
jgi:hypothetical protein